LNIIAEPAAIHSKRSFFSETKKKNLCVQSVKVPDIEKSPTASGLFQGISNFSSMAKDTN
jgi:hypothetical protein